MIRISPSKLIFPVIAFSTLFLFSIAHANTYTKFALITHDASDQSKVLNTNHNSKSISSSFPDSIRQWDNLIGSTASKYDLDPNLIAAVMLQESGGNADAYSDSGAVGLMQVMPRDGIAASFICYAGPCFKHRPSGEELFQPDFNVEYGARMLAGLIQQYGNVRDALKAYGPMDMAYEYADMVIAIWNSHT
jgi:hypothetical protein